MAVFLKEILQFMMVEQFAMYDVFNLYGNEFRDNSAKRGGALYVSQTNNTLVENQFEGNSASLGDVVYAMSCNDALIENNTGLTPGNFIAPSMTI